MIAMGLVGILSFAIMQLMKTGAKSQSSLESSFDLTSLHSSIEKHFLSPRGCEASLKNLSVGGALPAVYDYESDGETQVAAFNLNQDYGKVSITSITIDSTVTSTSDGAYTNLIIVYDRSNSGKRDSFGSKTITKKIQVFIDNCQRNLLVNEPSINNLQTTCEGLGGLLKDYEQATDSTWFGTCQYCALAREAIHDCLKAQI